MTRSQIKTRLKQNFKCIDGLLSWSIESIDTNKMTATCLVQYTWSDIDFDQAEKVIFQLYPSKLYILGETLESKIVNI
jgi:hypothetical protein